MALLVTLAFQTSALMLAEGITRRAPLIGTWAPEGAGAGPVTGAAAAGRGAVEVPEGAAAACEVPLQFATNHSRSSLERYSVPRISVQLVRIGTAVEVGAGGTRVGV